jgi:hypothetical protein
MRATPRSISDMGSLMILHAFDQPVQLAERMIHRLQEGTVKR